MGLYVVTGISRGIGRAVAVELLRAGHGVIGLARDRAQVRDLELTGLVEADLSDPASLSELLAPFLPVWTELDGIVHSAGISRPGPLAEASVQDFEDQFEVNVVAVAELTRLLLPALLAVRGTVVLVNSGSGLNARAPLASYGVSKHALRGYADALRAEYPQLRVSSVFPGRTATDMQRELRAVEDGAYVAEDYLRASTVAGVICSVLTLPPDAVITDVTVRPA